jgi:hypothetical protein
MIKSFGQYDCCCKNGTGKTATSGLIATGFNKFFLGKRLKQKNFFSKISCSSFPFAGDYAFYG